MERDPIETAHPQRGDAVVMLERRQFEAHVVVCPTCRGFLSQMRATRERLGEDVPPEFPAELADSIVSASRHGKSSGDDRL